ncbi:filamentous hemagglutinin N-terminal domain-containing protein [Pleurocapsa sp. PCC 7319]|uniref:two-partner secretion domain-containing protein n=1 Tax=Pleurocapsa sp. PCC 7319 TaxID=118161 RepID=UPI000348ED13|nr:filamentous hemagglutinin N-terminal domain-containing protein [Pleurocapsa sp. PCC 7319]
MKKKLSLLLFLVSCIIIPGILLKPATAQVTPDGTTSTTVNADGNDLTIQDGDRAGNNLFHSFQDFSVPNGGEAFFDNDANIANILSRVTGGNISNIDGLIRANGSANLFLINPAGIIFGQDARLDLGGSFYGSSASSILFEDGIEFSATDSENPPLLTINAPLGLGLEDNPGQIINRSLGQNSNQEVVGLEVAPGNNLALIGGNINFETGLATARGGNIKLGGLSEAGTVDINPDGSLSFPDGVTKADVNLSNFSVVNATGTGGGSVSVNAGNLNLAAGEFGSSFIIAGIRAESISAEAQAGDVTIDVAEKITLNDSFITNQVDSGGVGNSGRIVINTGSIEAINGGQVDASTFGRGDAGIVALTATGDITFDGEDLEGFQSGATSTVTSGAEGNAGGVTIRTNNLTLRAGGRVDASTFGRGNAGSVNITATGDITFDGEDSEGIPSGATSQVTSGAVGNAGGVTIRTNNLTLSAGGRADASTFGRGNAGTVALTATGDITFDGEDSEGIPSGATSQVNLDAVGNAGGVTIRTNNLTLSAGGRVDASTFGRGNAGTVALTATGDITFDGEDSDGTPSGAISVVTPDAEGNAGGVTIDAANLTLTNGGQVNASTSGQGDAGSVDITATGDLIFDGEDLDGTPSGVFGAVDQDAVGDAGGVTINTANLTLTNGGQVNTSTFGEGNSENVEIRAQNTIAIDGDASGVFSAVGEGVVGNAGDVTIDAANLELSAGGLIATFTVGAGNAGDVTIDAANLELSAGGLIATTTLGAGDAGDLTVNATESIFINGLNAEGDVSSGLYANALINDGNGGNVNVITNQLTINDGGTIDVGNFDNLVVISQLTVDDSGTIDVGNLDDSNASPAGTGEPGTINIEVNSINLSNRASIVAATQAETTSNSANINLQVADRITLEDNSLISAQAFENADGGNLTIDTDFLVAFPSEGNGNDLIASAEQGDGGNIDITAEFLLGIEERPLDPVTNDINASSEFGLDGTIGINQLDVNPVEALEELPMSVIDVVGLVAQNLCQQGKGSEFIVTGKGGVAPNPSQVRDGEVTAVDLVAPATGEESEQVETVKEAESNREIEEEKEIIEAQGWIINDRGNVELVAQKTDVNGSLPQPQDDRVCSK